MSLPAISIVTPSFNQAEFLEETIHSVLSQKYPRLEYVVVDGGSTDGSVDIIKRHAGDLRYWASEKDDGHGHALNKGFTQTSGEIMAWINSDDKYLPWTLEVVGRIFSEFPHVSWISGFPSYWSSTGFLTSASRAPKTIYDFLLGNYQWIQQESVFWRRSLWERAGGTINQEYRFMVDGELWTRFFLHADLYYVDCILGGYRVHSANRARDNQREVQAEMERAISAMRRTCSPDVLETCSTLSMLDGIKKAPVLKYLPVSGLGRKAVPAAFSSASYPNLFFEDGVWKERRLAFSL